MTYEDLQKANEAIKTTTLERKDKDGNIIKKDYAEVNQRIKAFRMCYPEGFILTSMQSCVDGVCIFNASCGYYENGSSVVLGTGTAYEKENSTFINRTSYIENCETSAVGRALGMAGFGIDTSVCSLEEVSNAILNQSAQGEQKQEYRKATAKQLEILRKYYAGDNLKQLLEHNGIEKIEDLPIQKASEIIGKLKERKTNE